MGGTRLPGWPALSCPATRPTKWCALYNSSSPHGASYAVCLIRRHGTACAPLRRSPPSDPLCRKSHLAGRRRCSCLAVCLAGYTRTRQQVGGRMVWGGGRCVGDAGRGTASRLHLGESELGYPHPHQIAPECAHSATHCPPHCPPPPPPSRHPRTASSSCFPRGPGHHAHLGRHLHHLRQRLEPGEGRVQGRARSG